MKKILIFLFTFFPLISSQEIFVKTFSTIDLKKSFTSLNFTIKSDPKTFHSHYIILDVSLLKDIYSSYHFNLLSQYASNIICEFEYFEDGNFEEIIKKIKSKNEKKTGTFKPILYPNTDEISYLKVTKTYEKTKFISIRFNYENNNQFINIYVTFLQILTPQKLGGDFSYSFKGVSNVFQINTTSIHRDNKMILFSDSNFLIYDEDKIIKNIPESLTRIYLYAHVKIPSKNKIIYIFVYSKNDAVFKIKHINTKDVKMHFYDFQESGTKNAFQIYINNCKKKHYFFGKTFPNMNDYFLFPEINFGDVQTKIINSMNEIVNSVNFPYVSLEGNIFNRVKELKEQEFILEFTCNSPSLISVRNMNKNNFRPLIKKGETQYIYLDCRDSYYPEIFEDNTKIKLKLVDPLTHIKIKYSKNKKSRNISNENRLKDTYKVLDTLNRDDAIKISNPADHFVWTELISETDESLYNIIDNEMEGYASTEKPYYFIKIPNDKEFKEFHVILSTQSNVPREIYYYMGFGVMPYIYSPNYYVNFKVLSKNSPFIINVRNPYKFIRSNPSVKHFYISLSGLNHNDIYIYHYYDRRITLDEDEDYISVKMQNVTLKQNLPDSNILLQFDNCENKKIEFSIELDGKKDIYSFEDSTKFYYLPIKNNDNFPKISFLNTNERMVRYIYSQEKEFNCAEDYDKKIIIQKEMYNLIFKFKKPSKINHKYMEYLILVFKDFDKSKLEDLKNRCYVEKLINGLEKLKYQKYSFVSNNEEVEYRLRIEKNDTSTSMAVVVLSKEINGLRIENLYEPNYFEIEVVDGKLKKNSFKNTFIFIFTFLLILLLLKFILKRNFKKKYYNQYSRMSDDEIFVY